jgi:cytosine deaminase
MRGFEGVKALVDKYKWAIDIELCVMPQEGLTNNPGTDELMVEALKNGARVVGAAPSYDSDSAAQIHRVFEMAREFDADIDMHVDSGPTAEHLDTLLVCDLAEKYKWGGRVAVGHVGKLSTMPFKDLDKVARRMADTGVAATVLTATDLYLGGRHTDHNVPRNVPRPELPDGARRHLLGRIQQHPQSVHARSATASCCARSTCTPSSPSAPTTTR